MRKNDYAPTLRCHPEERSDEGSHKPRPAPPLPPLACRPCNSRLQFLPASLILKMEEYPQIGLVNNGRDRLAFPAVCLGAAWHQVAPFCPSARLRFPFSAGATCADVRQGTGKTDCHVGLRPPRNDMRRGGYQPPADPLPRPTRRADDIRPYGANRSVSLIS